MRIGEMKESKYLKKEDVGTGKLVTIASMEQQNVAMEDQPPDMKWVLHFHEYNKGMVINWTNIQLIAKAVGSEETNDWVGKKIVVFEDPNVSFGGKLVGGIRVRAPRQTSVQSTPVMVQTSTPPPDYDDTDIPF